MTYVQGIKKIRQKQKFRYENKKKFFDDNCRQQKNIVKVKPGANLLQAVQNTHIDTESMSAAYVVV